MNDYRGVIIEESLASKVVLKKLKIISTKIEKVEKKHKTPWVSQWTLHTVEIPEVEAKIMAERISESLDRDHSWYADFKNDTHHYIVFRGKIFCVARKSQEQYDTVKRYGISLGIPEYQVDFHPMSKVGKIS